MGGGALGGALGLRGLPLRRHWQRTLHLDRGTGLEADGTGMSC
jgi:hypothetical protein